MALRYNPFNGSFDFTRSPGSYLDGEVATFADLPLDTAAAPLNSAWLVREASGLWLLTRKPAGIYIRTATGGTDRNADYTYASAFPDVFSDANFTLYDDADSTKNAKFQLSNLTTGQTRTLTVPDKSGTLATTDAGDLTTGTLADARLSSNVPLKDAANTFTANQTLDGTNNVAPNQTAASGASIMTRDLGDLRYSQISGTKTYGIFTALDNQPPATDFATLDTRNSIAVLDFDDAATESAVFVGILPESADVSSGLIVSLRWMATTATSGDVRWSVAWEKSNTALDSDSFDTATAATATANGTSGIVTVTNITCTNIDTLAASDLFRLRVQRLGGDAADTMTGDAELIAVEIRSAA